MRGGRRRPWRASAVASLVSAPIPANTPAINPVILRGTVASSTPSMRTGPSVIIASPGPRALAVALAARAASTSLAALAVSLPAAGPHDGSSP